MLDYLFSELCCNLIDSSVLSLGNCYEHVGDEEDLDYHEHHEHPGTTEHLNNQCKDTGFIRGKNTWIGSNPSPTRKLADQLTDTAMDVAVGLPDWANSSVTKNHGMEPGPVANPTTNKITATMATYDITWTIF